MEIRNLQKTGGASYTIILPKDWVKSLNLNEKDKVEIFKQKKDQLAIRPQREKRELSSTIYVDSYSKERILREIIALYLSGVMEINVRSQMYSNELRSTIREVSYKLAGFEIFDTTSNNLILKNVAENRISVVEYIGKMIRIINSMYADMENVLFENDKLLAKDIIDRDVEVDRIELITIREFNILLNSLYPSENSDIFLLEKHYYEHVAIRLERIADHIVRIAMTTLQLNKSEKIVLTKSEKDRIKRVHRYLDQANLIIQNLDRLKAHDLLDELDHINKNAFINKEISKKSSINILIEDSIERIRSYISNIAEETINYDSIKRSIAY